MKPRAKDMRFLRVGRLTALMHVGTSEGASAAALWLCRCRCGRTRTVRGIDLRAGQVRACRRCTKRNRLIMDHVCAERRRRGRCAFVNSMERRTSLTGRELVSALSDVHNIDEALDYLHGYPIEPPPRPSKHWTLALLAEDRTKSKVRAA